MSLKKAGQKLIQYGRSGQALVEYALILVLVAILFGVALAATGPAIANVFSNTVYNLLGQDPRSIEDLLAGRGDNEAFWATVQWVAENPPEEAALPPRPPFDPPPSATPGPSPTATPVTPTATATNTATLGPTATPRDFEHIAPWLDTIDNPEWWRVDTSVWIGGDDWFGQYFPNRTLSGTPDLERFNGQIGTGQHRWQINFDWGNGSPIEGWRTDDFSIRWTRNIWVQGPDPLTVRFTTTADDGVRLWFNYQPGCAAVNSGGDPTGSMTTYDTGCLIIDNWRLQNATTMSAVRTLPPGFHTLQLDYFEAGSNASVNLVIEGLTSQGVLGDSTIPPGGQPQCAWNHANTSRANSRVFMWEEQANGDFPANMRCYLELRGSINIASLNSPKLIFWDVWDLVGSTSVWLEVAEYRPNAADRQWTRIDLRNGGANYNWTRNVIDLAPVVAGYSSQRMTLRFGMENSGGGARRRWYVDDIEVRDFNNNTRFFTVCTGSGTTPEQRKATCGSYWDLNSQAQRNDFLYSGRWGLTAAAAQGSGMGWDSNAETTNYESNFEGSPRVHSLELNGWVDLRPPDIPDADGNDGPPQLSFFHRYDVNRGDSIALQWTRDPHGLGPANWQNVEVFANAGSNRITQTDMRLQEVLLTGIPNWNTQPFRLRFALTVDSSFEGTGWKLDNIYIQRVSRARFTDYPFFDGAEEGPANWLMEGQWGITNTTGVFNSRHAFTDSVQGDYLHGSNASMSLRYVIDFNNDTPENRLEYFDNNPAGGNSQVNPATRPMLTFWHWRDLQSSDHLIVEWSKNRGQTWTEMWSYRYNANTRRQLAWERIEIDLNFLVAGTRDTPDPYDDDTLIRFRLDARTNASVADGVYIDNIEIRDYNERAHRLWDSSVDAPGIGLGDSIRLVDDMEGNWSVRWHLGGDWGIVNDSVRSGLNAMNESPGGNTRHQTYQVLEMDRIIDMRGTLPGDNPTLYWWNRYWVGQSDTIAVQVAVENPAYQRAANETNHERRTGWNDWSTLWSRGQWSRVDTWIREQVPLNSYVGQRIKVRFVFNAFGGSDNRYGWYIDDVRIEHRNPTPINLPFSDPAQNMQNWVAEGIWGLAPDQWRGTGGGPASLGPGFWTGVFYDCERILGRRCNNITDFNNVLYENFGAGIPRAYQAGRDLQEFVLDVYHDFGSTNRPPGGTDDDTWFDYFAGRWTRPVTIEAGGGGEFTFITVSDDGVRLRYSCDAPCIAPPGWNIINNWTYHGRTVDIGTASFSPGNYTLTLEWFEATGQAVIILSAGKNNFSFTDSPKGGNGPAFPEILSVPFGNSSLILNRPLRLTGATRPVLQFYTRYRLGGTARVEVTVDGGFTWTQANLTANTNGFVCPAGATCNPTMVNDFWPADPTVWQQRQLNLSNYISNGLLGLRFRLETAGPSNVRDGVYITDIEVNQ